MRNRIAVLLGATALLFTACGAPVDEASNTTGPGETPSTTTSSAGPSTTNDTTTTTTPDGSGLHVIVQPDETGSLPDDVILSCPSGPAFPASTLEDLPGDEAVDVPGLDTAMQSFLSGEEGQYWPQEGWRLLYQTESRLQIMHHDTETGGIAFMGFEFRDGAWQWAGASAGGPCPLQTSLPEHLQVVTWRVDPAAEPLTAEMTSIPVLVTEAACASGKPVGDRLVGPEVVVTDTEVLIAFAARAQGGAQTCPSNPETGVTVELPEPLGDRVLRDGLDTDLDLGDFLE